MSTPTGQLPRSIDACTHVIRGLIVYSCARQHPRLASKVVDMSSIPEPWASAMKKQNLVDGRSGDRPSWSALARTAGVHTSTVIAMAEGKRETETDVLQKVAKALRIDVRTVSKWAGQARSVRAPYSPPADANLLDSEERDTIDRLIRLLAKGKKRNTEDRPQREVVQDAGTPTTLRPAPDPSRTDNVVNFPRDSRGDLILPEGIAAYDTGRKSVGRMQNEAQDADAEASQDPRGGWDDVNQDPNGQE